MKKIKKIGGLIAVFLLTIYNTCFADVVMSGQSYSGHGTSWKNIPDSKPELTVNYVLIGIIVAVVIVCAVFIIRSIMKKKKEKENDNK